MSQRFSTAVPLSEGGTASLYTARDLVLGRQVVLKVPHRTGAAQVERTFREARALAAVRHPGVCQVYEVGFADGRPFIALEMVEGRTLTEVRGELEPRERIALVACVADAIQAVHDVGVVHRDLKPDNVMVRAGSTGGVQPVVVDFGLVHFPDDSALLTQAGTPLGTPGFMPPEAVRGDGAASDPRSDVYGLGAILYFVLTGRPVFEGASAAAVMLRTLSEEPRPPRALAPEVDPALEAIVLHCLEKEPAARYATARALGDDLRRYLAGSPVHAPRRGRLSRRLRRLARGPGRARAALLVAAAALVAGSIALGVLERRRLDQRAELQRWADDLEWRLRADYMAPRHDTTAHERDVRARLAELRARLPALGRAAQGDAHFALARVWAALAEDAEAERHLRAAWARGRDDPEAAYLLGLVQSRRYAGAMKRAVRSLDPRLRAARIAVLERELLAPARALLDRARGARLPVPAEYPHILVAAQEQRFDAALDMLGALRRRVPWFFEAWITEGQVLQVRGLSAYSDGDLRATLSFFERAHRAYSEARAAGQSHPAVHESLCVTAADVIGVREELGGTASPPELESMLGLCDEALLVAPAHPSTLAGAAWAYEFAARHAFRLGDEARGVDRVKRAVAQAARAVELNPHDPSALAIWTTALLTSRDLLSATPGAVEADAELGRAASALERALAEEPGSSDWLLVFRGLVALVVGRTQRLEAPLGTLDKARALADRLSGPQPRSFVVPHELSVGLQRLSQAVEGFGVPTAEIDERALRLAEQARAMNPRMLDTWMAAITARRANAMRRCVAAPGTEVEDFDEARKHLREVERAGWAAEAIAGQRLAGRLFEAHCRLAQGQPVRREAVELARQVRRLAARRRVAPELEFWVTLFTWRALLADPAAPRAALLRARHAPLEWDGADTPLSALWRVQVPLTRADLALRLGEDPRALLDQAGADLARIEARVAPNARAPVGALRTRALLEFLRLRARPDTPAAELAAGARRVLELPHLGTRVDLIWLYWRARVARLAAETRAVRRPA